MKAIVVRGHGGPEVLKVEEVARPEAGAGQVLIQVRAAGVNPIDTYLRSGAYPNAKVPYTPGFDAAGIVEAAGNGVAGLKTGDRVYTTGSLTGTYAEFALCDAAKVHPIPRNVGFEEGAGISIPYATAYRALFQKAHARPGEWVLVHGASGGVGSAALQWAKAAGLRAIGTAGSDEGLILVKNQGADHAVNHNNIGYQQELTSLTGGRGADIILEMLANVNLGNDLGMLATGGRIIVIGSRGKVEINPRDAMAREASIMGVMLSAAPLEDYRQIHTAIQTGLAAGFLKPIVGKKFKLEEAAKAHEAVLAPGAYGKIVLVND